MPGATGADTTAMFLWEDNGFAATPTDTTHKTFGGNARINTLSGSNNAVRVFNPNSREAAKIIEQNFSGSFSVEFVLTNPWWVRAVIDAPSTTGTAAPYTHAFTGDVPDSIQILTGQDLSTDVERTLEGCVVAQATVSVDVGGLVTVTLDGAYADDNDATGAITAQPTISERPMTFAQATLERPDATALSLVQNVSLTINNNTDLLNELGTRKAVDYSPKVRAVSVDYGRIVEDNTDLERMYGGASTVQEKNTDTTSITLMLDNGETGSAKNTLEFNVTTALADSYDVSGIGDPEADLRGNLSEMAASITATAENDTSTAP